MCEFVFTVNNGHEKCKTLLNLHWILCVYDRNLKGSNANCINARYRRHINTSEVNISNGFYLLQESFRLWRQLNVLTGEVQPKRKLWVSEAAKFLLQQFLDHRPHRKGIQIILTFIHLQEEEGDDEDSVTTVEISEVIF